MKVKQSLLKFVFIPIIVFVSPCQALEPIFIQMGGEPSTLDPARVIDQYGFGILRNVVEGLYKLDPDGNLVAGLAKSHRISKDGLSHYFKLRSDARWSDGKAVVVEDFIFALRRTLDPRTASPNADYFFSIKAARDVFLGKAPAESLGVSKFGDELLIRLEKPDPSLLMVLTMPAAAPLRQDAFLANKGEWSHKFPTTGDYQITVFKPDEVIELAPNKYGKTPGSQVIRYRILQEETTALNLFESGLLDVLSTVPMDQIEKFKQKKLIRLVPSTSVFYLSFNVSKAPFNNSDWRRAVASSIRRKELASLLHGAFEPITSYLPKSLDGAMPYKELRFEAATKKIRELSNKPRVKLAFGASAFTRLTMEKIQSDLEKALGLKVDLEPSELKVLLAKLKTDPPHMYFLGMSALYNDPLNHLNAFTHIAEPNFSRYQSKSYDDLVEKIKATEPGGKRAALARQANQILVEQDVVVVPVVLRTQVFAVSSRIKNFHLNPYQVIHLSSLRKK